MKKHIVVVNNVFFGGKQTNYEKNALPEENIKKSLQHIFFNSIGDKQKKSYNILNTCLKIRKISKFLMIILIFIKIRTVLFLP